MRARARRLAAAAAAAAGVALSAGRADAQAKRSLRVETEPPGASVYVGSKEDGAVCTTPCTFPAPVGDVILIVEVASHVPVVEQLTVRRRGPPQVARFKLVRAVGTVIVKGPPGATIRIGDVERGRAPARIEVDAGPHTVTLTVGGRPVLQDLIEVEADQEVAVRGTDPALGRDAAPAIDAEDVVEVQDESAIGAGPDQTTSVAAASAARAGAATRRDAPLVAVSAQIDLGVRRFTYENNLSPGLLRRADEVGQVIAGPVLELWPAAIAGVRALRGLAIIGRIQFPLNQQRVEGDALKNRVTTFWQSLEVSARYRWRIGGAAALDASAGFVRDQHQFNTSNADDLQLLPDADYRAIRAGARAALIFGGVEPYAGAESRVVIAGGALDRRFSRGASVDGLRGSVGVTGRVGPVGARLEASYTRYAWTFRYDSSDALKADGAVDAISLISAAVTYQY
jgi:hypothetical protein